jgi:hypothetical protein
MGLFRRVGLARTADDSQQGQSRYRTEKRWFGLPVFHCCIPLIAR